MSVSIPLQTLFANVRGGAATFLTSAGALSSVAAETTRTAHWVGGKPHALFEPARTNSIRNNTFTGGTAGVLGGAGGVLPTHFDIWNFPAASTTVAFGAEDGFSYMELRLNGTPTGNVDINFETANGILASDAQVWTSSVWLKQQSGSQTNIDNLQIGFLTFSSGPTFHAAYLETKTITTTATRFAFSDTVSNSDGSGTITHVRPTVKINWTSGAIDITLRFYAPQLELGAFATTPILTSGSAVTRAADNATCSTDTFPIDQNGGSIEIIGRAYYTTGGSATPRVVQVDDGTDSNRIVLSTNEGAGTLNLFQIVGGAVQANESVAYTSGDEFHAVLVFEENNVFLSLNGANSTPDTTATFPTGLLTTWRWARSAAAATSDAAVLINRIASHSHEFSTTGADAITA